jgi:FAD/FMN-containing dehydrogenase
MVQLLIEVLLDSGSETEMTAVWIRRADHTTPLYPQKAGTNFSDMQRSLGRYSSLAD